MSLYLTDAPMKKTARTFHYRILNICLALLIIIGFSCQKDCQNFDTKSCPDNIEEFIILRFDMDSLNGGFNKLELDTLKISRPGRNCNFLSIEDLKRAHIYDWKNGIFCAMHEYYCCGECATGFTLLNQRTGKIHIIDQIQYSRRKDKDYCCGDYYYIESFYYNGEKYAGGTDVMIFND